MNDRFRRTSTPTLLRRCLRPCAIAVVLACALPSSAQNICPPLSLPAVAAAAWDDDTAYEMTVRDVGGGRLRVTVVGDILSVDATRFASLVRTVDKAPGNVAEIVLDARVVRILEPLALQSGTIRIYADTVSFEGRGLIALTKSPSTATDGIEINAMQIDLRNALPLPLQMVVNASSARRVAVRAGRVVTNSGVVQESQAARTLWRRSTNFDGAFPTALPPGWDIRVGDDGAADAITAMTAPSAWPGYLAYKLRKHHAIAPFDKVRKDALVERMHTLRPLLERIERADVLMEMDALELLMKRNLDRRGFGPAYVPSEDLVVAMDRFAKSRSAGRIQLTNLRTVIASAHQTPSLDVQALGAARGRIQSLSDAQERTSLEIGEVFTQIGVAQAQAETINDAIKLDRENSKNELEQLKKKDKDLANIKAATTVVAVGASFIGTPAAGAAIAAGVGLAGDLVYAHNAGHPVNVETLVTIGQKSAEMFEKFKDARAAWDKHSEDLKVAKQVFDGKVVTLQGADKPLTKIDVAKRVGESANKFVNGIKEVSDQMGAIPRPDSLSLNQVEADNAALQQHLTDLAEVQKELAKLAGQLEGLQATLSANESAMAETRLVEQVLLELKPANDQEIMRWKTAALQLWVRELQGLYQDAMDLRRSLFFETWKVPNLPADLLTYPEEFTAYLAAGRYSPESPNATSPVTLTTEHLDNEIAKHMAVLDGIAKAIDQTWQSYLAERAAGAQPFFDQQELSARVGAPPTVRLFMDQINAQIRRQVVEPETRNNARFTLLIPFDMTPPPASLPERLLQVGVLSPKIKNPDSMDGKELVFDVTYRLAGELWREQQCAYVDLSVPGGAKTTVGRSSSNDLVSVNDKRIEAQKPLTFETLRQSRAAPPARTLYFLSVTVGGSQHHANWFNAPVLDSFTFWRRIVQ